MRRLHRWLGLVLGAWLAVAGGSGALIVFWPEIEAMGLPTAGPGPALPLAALAAAAAAARPEVPGGPLRLLPPAAPGERFQAQFQLADGSRTTLHLDPASGAVLGERRWGSQRIHWFYFLHNGALFGRWGGLAVGLAALPLLALLLAGLALWARRDALPWRERLIIRKGLRGRRRLANWHRVLGLRAALPLAIAAVTGLGIAFDQTTQAVLYRLVRPGPGAVAPLAPGRGPLDLDGAVALVEAARPGWRVSAIDRADTAGRIPLLLLPRDTGLPRAPSQALVDTGTGALLTLRDPDAVAHIGAWLMALHNGTAFGLPHRLAVVALGLLPAALGGLGLALWLRGRARLWQARARATA
jgi:uncharacterized iron-regulated membrane protein